MSQKQRNNTQTNKWGFIFYTVVYPDTVHVQQVGQFVTIPAITSNLCQSPYGWLAPITVSPCWCVVTLLLSQMLCKHPDMSVEESMLSQEVAVISIHTVEWQNNRLKMCNRQQIHKNLLWKQTRGPLVPLQYFTPTPTVLSASVAFLNVQVLRFPYCSEDVIHSTLFDSSTTTAVKHDPSLSGTLHGKVMTASRDQKHCNC